MSSVLADELATDILANLDSWHRILDGIDLETLSNDIRKDLIAIIQKRLDKPVKKWRYFSVNLFGNAHDAVRQINDHPEWDVIAMSFNGENGMPGSVTLVVYRQEIP